jgi:hypothetical protein
LLVDRQQINQKRLAKALDNLVGIDQDSGELVPSRKFRELDTRRRIVALLLGKQAAHELELIDDEEVGFSSNELSNRVGAAGGTIRNYVSQKLHFVESDNGRGGYHIPRTRIPDAIQFLEEETNQS